MVEGEPGSVAPKPTYPSSESLGVLPKIQVPGVLPRPTEPEPSAFAPDKLLGMLRRHTGWPGAHRLAIALVASEILLRALLGGAALGTGRILVPAHKQLFLLPTPGELTVTGLSPVQPSSGLTLGRQALSSWHLPEPGQAEQSRVKTQSVHKEGVLHRSLHLSWQTEYHISFSLN